LGWLLKELVLFFTKRVNFDMLNIILQLIGKVDYMQQQHFQDRAQDLQVPQLGIP
jgi:hypothetical protein